MKILLIIIVITFLLAGGYYMTTSNMDDISVNIEKIKKEQSEGEALIIDVRTAQEFASGHLKAADLNFDFMSGEFEEQLNKLDKNKTYYLYCRSGNRSGQAAKRMEAHGFERVYNIGGYADLVNAGFESSK